MTSSVITTHLFGRVYEGQREAANDLMPRIYSELRRIAALHAARERVGLTDQPSDLVQEVCLRLLKPGLGPWKSRRHFFSAASRAIRRILVDHARARLTKKRHPQNARRVPTPLTGPVSQELIALDAALKRLETISPRASRIVELRYFAGLSLRETADTLETGLTTVKDEWTLAKAWLRREIEEA